MPQLVFGHAPLDHITLASLADEETPDWDEPAITLEVSGSSDKTRFRTFQSIFSIADLRIFLDQLRVVLQDNTQGAYLASSDDKLKLKMRGQGTGSFQLDFEVSDAPEHRKAAERTHFIDRTQVKELVAAVETLLKLP